MRTEPCKLIDTKVVYKLINDMIIIGGGGGERDYSYNHSITKNGTLGMNNFILELHHKDAEEELCPWNALDERDQERPNVR